MKYTLNETNVSKGLACLLLLFHHLFYNEATVGLYFTFGAWDLKGLLALSLFASLGLEKLKTLIRYDRLNKGIISRIERKVKI